MRVILFRLEWFDCFMPQIEEELELSAATRRVQTYLAADVWMVDYDDQGLREVETLMGTWELDESQQRVRLTTDGSQVASLER